TIKNGAQIKHQYGRGLTIGTTGDLNLLAQYTSLKMGKLAGTFNGKVQNSRLTVEQIAPSTKIVNIDADYTTVALGFAAGFSADFNLNTSYGNFRYEDHIVSKKMISDDRSSHSTKQYTGKIGKGGTAVVRINTKYGTVTFK